MIKGKRATISFIIICLIAIVGCDDMKFNQTTDHDLLITENYSLAQIEILKRAVKSENLTFSAIKKEFDIQCVRKTYQGYYVVLGLVDGGKAFLFFDEEDFLNHVMVFNGFKDKTEIQDQVLNQITKSEMLSFDSSTIIMPVSSVEITAHLVKGGLCIVKYTRLKGGALLKDPIAASVIFICDKDLPAYEDPLVRDEVPFILEIDKK